MSEIPASSARPTSVETVSAHTRGSSESTVIRARTEAERLVSWVVSAFMVAGDSRWRRAASVWNCSGVREKTEGSPPTSVRDVSWVQR